MLQQPTKRNSSNSSSHFKRPRQTSIWVIFSILVINLRGAAGISQDQAALKKQDASISSKSASDKAAVDDILRDTMVLLDALDQRLTSVQNKTPNALMRDNLRALESLDDDSSSSSSSSSDAAEWPALDGGQQANGGGGGARLTATLRHDEPMLASASTNLDQQQAHQLIESSQPPPPRPALSAASPPAAAGEQAGVASKQARQLMDESQLASDSTERHIKFTLDLMQAIFASQSYSAKTNSIDSFLISPLSVQMVLMMMHLGARGHTRREIGNGLHLAAEREQAASDRGEPGPKQLKRRHQAVDGAAAAANVATTKPAQPSRQPAASVAPQRQPQPQPQQPARLDGAHEMFGAAMRNLLKDPSVMKALTSANQLFLQRNVPLLQQYEWAIKHFYGADIKLVDFQHQPAAAAQANVSTTPSGDNHSIGGGGSATNSSGQAQQQQQSSTGPQLDGSVQQLINEWIERQTRGKICNFLGAPVSPSTLLMAINVIYFKGDWQYKFDPADTEADAWFTQADGQQVKVPMMVNRLPLAFAHDAAMRTSVIELPYKAQRLGLFLLLPDEVSGIFHTMQMLNSSSFANLISSMRKPSHSAAAAAASSPSSPLSDQPPAGANNGINIRIPKFSIESSPRLSQILIQQLGLKSLFTPDSADLSGMFAASSTRRTQTAGNFSSSKDDAQLSSSSSPPPQVALDELIHKAVLQVDEQGSVAAATSATIVERVGVFNSNYFEADHPFLIFLMDKQTGLVLFSGAFAGNSNNHDAQQKNHRQQQQQHHKNN